MTKPGEGVSIFTYSYLRAGAPPRASEVGEEKFDQNLGAIFNNKLFDFVLIKTKKNNIFGYKYHPYMFRFSLDLKKIYVFDTRRSQRVKKRIF